MLDQGQVREDALPSGAIGYRSEEGARDRRQRGCL
jgi:hypothetical protein